MKTYLLLSLLAVLLSVNGCNVKIGEGGDIVEPSEKIVKAKYPHLRTISSTLSLRTKTVS